MECQNNALGNDAIELYNLEKYKYHVPLELLQNVVLPAMVVLQIVTVLPSAGAKAREDGALLIATIADDSAVAFAHATQVFVCHGSVRCISLSGQSWHGMDHHRPTAILSPDC